MSAEHDPARGSEEPARGSEEPAPARDDDFLDRPVERSPYEGESPAEPAVAEPAAATHASSDVTAAPAAPPATETYGRSPGADSRGMLPAREGRRSVLERMLVRVIATCGIIGIGVAIAAIMVSSKSQGWVVGLVVSIVSVILAALLWSSDRL